ncbi:hypothetical protein [Salipiger abyssi]|uniref:hypothetical protein n=1 Tax=Salipiger abyssi TaxID=1250539 RepID=UPI0040584567
MWRIAFFSLFLISSACDFVNSELYEPDGFAGPTLNERLPAVTPVQRADRYLLGLAILGPVTLETSANGTDTRNTISQINSSYAALSDLYAAEKACADPLACRLSQPANSVYSFETVSYDVQKRYYRLAKTLVVNLDLEETVSDIANLDLAALLKLVERAREMVPAVRRGAATYRDAIFIYATGVSESCTVSYTAAGKEIPDACRNLETALTDLYKTGRPYTLPETGERRLRKILSLAQEAATKSAWELGDDRRRALVFHLDKACDVAFELQTVGDDPAGQADSCGQQTKPGEVSKARDALLGQFGS